MRVRPSSVEIDDEPSGTKTLDCVLGCSAATLDVLETEGSEEVVSASFVDADEQPATTTNSQSASEHLRTTVMWFSVP